MQLPFSKQLITAALIVVLAPAATVIGAQSFSDFISQPQPYVVAQAPPPAGDFQPQPPPLSSQPGLPPGDFHPPPPPGPQPGVQPGAAGPLGPPPGPGLGLPTPSGALLGLPPGRIQPSPGVGGEPPAGAQPPVNAPPSGLSPVNAAPGEIKPDICPKMPEIECPPGTVRIGGIGPNGCPWSQCKPEGEPGPSECHPPPQGLECKVIGKYENGCPKYECASEKAHCPVPPPDLECAVVDKYPNGCPKYECKAKEGGWSCPAPPSGRKCEEAGKYPNGCVKFKCEHAEPPRSMPSPPPALENCARDVLGSEAYEQMLKGGLQPTEEQKKLVGEKCGQFKREMPKPPGEFPGRGEFPGQPPGGAFPGRGEGLDRAPGAGGFGPGGPTMGPGGPEGGFGPSEADFERMEQEQKARMLKEMQRGLRGMETGLRMMDRGLNACRKAKIDTADADASLATIKDIVAKVRAATDPETLPDLMSDLPEHFDKLREIVENCNRVAQLPRITKQLNREIKQLAGEHRRLTSQATRAKLDLADQLSAIGSGIETLKVMLAEVSKVKTTEEFEDAMAKLESLHDTFEDLRENMDAVRSVLNVKRAITEAKREIRTVERFLGSLKRKGANTAALEEMVAAGKVLVAELDALAKQKPIDADALHEAFEALEDLGGRAEEELAKLRGVKFEDRFQPKFDKSAASDVALPDSFRQFEREEEPEGPSEIESLLGF